MATESTHDILSTPNPAEFALRVWVDASVIASRPNLIPALGTPYNQFPTGVLSGDFRAKWGDYILTASENGGGAHVGQIGLIFGKSKTQAEADTPYLTESDFEEFGWDQVITGIHVFKDRKFTQSTNGISNGVAGIITRPTTTINVYGVPATRTGTLRITKKYLNSVPFNIPRRPVPIPELIDLTIGGETRVIPESLHDNINIPDQQAALDSSYNGTSDGGGGKAPGYKKRRTNFTRWAPYFFPDTQTRLETGLYERTVVLNIPPRFPKPLIIR